MEISRGIAASERGGADDVLNGVALCEGVGRGNHKAVGVAQSRIASYSALALDSMRNVAGLTRKQLAEAAKLSPATVARLEERGIGQRTDVEILRRWAKACGYNLLMTASGRNRTLTVVLAYEHRASVLKERRSRTVNRESA